MNSFADLQLIEPLCRALEAGNYEIPTPIQEESIPHLLNGGDILGTAQTGTGKTAAFALPVLQHIAGIGKAPRKKEVRALVLTPTRELGMQVADSFKRYGQFTKSNCTLVCGGVGYAPQVRTLSRGVDVLVATPGRLLDLYNEGHLDLKYVQFLVLDEADRMLDMGFQRDIEKVISYVAQERQTILFSATMPPSIEKFARKILIEPKRVDVSPNNLAASNIDEQVVFVQKSNKKALLLELLSGQDIERAIVFTRTKHVAERLSKTLKKQNVSADAIHGNKSQNQRQRSLDRFRDGKVRVLVATDVAARGIDVDEVSHVINYELSNEPESYVHRIGRTARAGNSGIALTLCDSAESEILASVERLLDREIDVRSDMEYHDADIARDHRQARHSRGRSRGSSNRSRGRKTGSRSRQGYGSRKSAGRRRASR